MELYRSHSPSSVKGGSGEGAVGFVLAAAGNNSGVNMASQSSFTLPSNYCLKQQLPTHPEGAHRGIYWRKSCSATLAVVGAVSIATLVNQNTSAQASGSSTRDSCLNVLRL